MDPPLTWTFLDKGISLKLKFLESEYSKDFKSLATDQTYMTSNIDMELLFLNQLQTEISLNGGISASKFLDLVNSQEFAAKGNFIQGYIQDPIERIEKKINNTRNKQNDNKEKAVGIWQ
jgi:hypothetical protein